MPKCSQSAKINVATGDITTALVYKSLNNHISTSLLALYINHNYILFRSPLKIHKRVFTTKECKHPQQKITGPNLSLVQSNGNCIVYFFKNCYISTSTSLCDSTIKNYLLVKFLFYSYTYALTVKHQANDCDMII